ncbi:hypothetical protein YC2023_086253 [Brassica napus]
MILIQFIQLDGFLEKAVQDHENADEERSDFVHMLLSVQRDETTSFEFERRDLKFVLLDMLFGAAPTTFALLEWTMTELIRHPECSKKLKLRS